MEILPWLADLCLATISESGESEKKLTMEEVPRLWMFYQINEITEKLQVSVTNSEAGLRPTRHWSLPK